MKHIHITLVAVALVCCAGTAALARDSFKIEVLSATVKSKVVPGAQVILQKEGQTSQTGTTDAQGKAIVANPFGSDNTAITLIIKKDGYSPLIAKCPCDGMSYAISEKMAQLDGLRVVLNWGGEPQDLDLHAVYPGNHVFWDSKQGSDAFLDVDDIDGYGPETVTILRKREGEKYIFAVHNYSDRESSGSSTLGSSMAKVLVYVGQSMIRSYYVPTGKQGTLWILFGIDGSGSFHDIDQMTAATEPATVGTMLEDIIEKPDFGPAPAMSAQALTLAKQLNKKGEDAYHAGDLEGSVEFYRQAIDMNPDYGQAYSNLGLSYQKLNRQAEAIWASRKAIELASGSTAPTVRASSYYNIARMYEAAGQWRDALRHYELALQNKQHKAYTEGIERMKAKLQAPGR